MVGKVIVDGDDALGPGEGTAHLHASFHVFKSPQGVGGHARRHANMVSRCNGRQRVQLVMHAGECPADLRHEVTLVQHVKFMGFSDGAEVAHGSAETANFAPAASVQHTRQTFLQAVDDDSSRAMRAFAGHCAHQVMKLALYRGQVIKNVRMVELQVVEDGGTGTVMHKFAAFIKKRGVVFVGFNHKHTTCAQPGRDIKVHGDAADKKAGLKPGVLQHPGNHGRGGRFAVRAGHSDDMASLQDMLGQPLRTAGVGQARIQNRLHQRKFGRSICQMRAADYIAHDKQVGLERQLLRAKALDQINTQRPKLVAHGRVNA